ncbi:hypothetical protein H4219_004543 [Mycoemilia scoparia]|uniref:Glycosyl transferase family 25 domain-containing protein n=1 Tax=Mycoemilia scoparia TaxID=417184 RepID=A0A9W7ZRC7_9FUNG|nr:hypothetical protein H4219_004543 [Mycoemilia scoparia]
MAIAIFDHLATKVRHISNIILIRKRLAIILLAVTITIYIVSTQNLSLGFESRKVRVIPDIIAKEYVHPDPDFAKLGHEKDLYVDHIYCITAKDKQDRRDNMNNQFELLGIRAEYVMGVDWKNDESAKDILKHTKPYLRDEQNACWVSHLRLWKDIVAKGYKTALILEDDIDFSMNIKETMKTSLEILNRRTRATANHEDHDFGWDIFYPGHCSDFEKYQDSVDPSFKDLRYGIMPFCTHGYVVNIKSAALLVDLMSIPLERALDLHMVFHSAFSTEKGVLRMFSIEPSQINQRRDLYKNDPGIRNIHFLSPPNSTLDYISNNPQVLLNK